MLNYGFALGAPTMFGRGGGWKMPFYEGGSGYEGDIIEVDYLDVLGPASNAIEGQQIRTRRISSNFGYKTHQSLCLYASAHSKCTYPSSLRYYEVCPHGQLLVCDKG